MSVPRAPQSSNIASAPHEIRLDALNPSSPTPAQTRDASLEEESDEDDLIPSVRKRRKMSPSLIGSSPPRRRSTRLQSSSSSHALYSSHGLPPELQSSPSSRRSRRLRPKASPQSTRSSRSHSVDLVDLPTPTHQPSSRFSDIGTAESSDDDDAIMASTPTLRRHRPRATAEVPFVVDDEEIQYISDDEEPRFAAPRSSRKKPADFIVDDDEVQGLSSDSGVDRTSHENVKSRILSTSHKSPRTSRRRTREEQDELDEDLRDLRDSEEEEDDATMPRTRGGPVTTQRDQARQHLELLRRRRAGEKVRRVEDSGEETGEAEGIAIDHITYPNYDFVSEGSVHSSVDTEQESIQEHMEGEEDDFVIDDSTGRLGRPHPDMPLQFTSFASAKPRELFPHIVEWLVKNKIAPAFSRDDELYSLAFARVDDQVKAQAGSRLISSAWGTNFKRAILARPTMKMVALPGEDEDNLRTCDACNRSGHPARYEFVFSGEPYINGTLEPVDGSDDEDAFEDNLSRDENGHLLPSQTQRFYLGRFCAANAEMGHKLTHWKHHLNESLLSYLEEQGVISADAIVARERTNKKKREKEAENIVDSMEATGVISELWADFENDLNDARLGMEDFEKKGGRSKGRIGAVRYQ